MNSIDQMTAEELWKKFKTENKIEECEYQAWQFGFDADLLANLVISGEKKGTTALRLWSERGEEPLPTVGQYNVILNINENAVCIIQTKKVEILPFHQVSAEFAYKEGEGDKSLTYWRETHKAFFENELSQIGLEFDESMEVVCEEFEVVYKRQEE